MMVHKNPAFACTSLVLYWQQKFIMYIDLCRQAGHMG